MSLSLCTVCNRHVRGDACPFCGSASEETITTASRLRTAVVIAGVAVIASTACAVGGYGGPPPGDPSNTPTSTSDAGSD
jgi:hypothetical protein